MLPVWGIRAVADRRALAAAADIAVGTGPAEDNPAERLGRGRKVEMDLDLDEELAVGAGELVLRTGIWAPRPLWKPTKMSRVSTTVAGRADQALVDRGPGGRDERPGVEIVGVEGHVGDDRDRLRLGPSPRPVPPRPAPGRTSNAATAAYTVDRMDLLHAEIPPEPGDVGVAGYTHDAGAGVPHL